MRTGGPRRGSRRPRRWQGHLLLPAISLLNRRRLGQLARPPCARQCAAAAAAGACRLPASRHHGVCVLCRTRTSPGPLAVDCLLHPSEEWGWPSATAVTIPHTAIALSGKDAMEARKASASCDKKRQPTAGKRQQKSTQASAGGCARLRSFRREAGVEIENKRYTIDRRVCSVGGGETCSQSMWDAQHCALDARCAAHSTPATVSRTLLRPSRRFRRRVSASMASAACGLCCVPCHSFASARRPRPPPTDDAAAAQEPGRQHSSRSRSQHTLATLATASAWHPPADLALTCSRWPDMLPMPSRERAHLMARGFHGVPQVHSRGLPPDRRVCASGRGDCKCTALSSLRLARLGSCASGLACGRCGGGDTGRCPSVLLWQRQGKQGSSSLSLSLAVSFSRCLFLSLTLFLSFAVSLSADHRQAPTHKTPYGIGKVVTLRARLTLCVHPSTLH